MSEGQITIELLRGGEVFETKEFGTKTIEIGKLSRSDVQLDDENVSRKHARIEIETDGRVYIQDLGSTNGTRLNGMRITRAHLADGDEFEVGVTRLRISLSDDLKRMAAAKAPSARTQISREGFYRTEESVQGGSLALEAALLWEDSPVQVDAFRRAKVPVRLRALLLLLFAVGPLELWLCALLSALVAADGSVGIGLGAAGLGLAIYFVMDIDAWRGLLARAWWMVRNGEGVFVGETHECRFFLPSETVGAREYPLLVPYGKGWALNLKHDDIKGDLLIEGEVLSVAEARTNGLVKGNKLPMTPGTKCRLRFGQFSMLLSFVAVPPKPKAAYFAGPHVQEIMYMGVSFLLHFGLLILFVYLHPEDEIQIRRGKSTMLARFVQVESIKQKEEEEEEEEPEKIDLEKKEEKVELDTGIQESEKLLEEKQPEMIKQRDRPKTFRDRVQQKKRNQDLAKKTSEKYIPTTTLARITGSNLLNRPSSGGLKILGSAGAAGPNDAFNAFAGSTSSSSGAGFLGLNEMGGTVGAGGDPNKKNLLVAGLGKEGRKKGKRFGNVKFKDSVQKAVVTTGRVSVSGGALTRAIIKKYINRQKGSIILCYKRAVQKKPDLEGKVIVKFVISPTGSVMRPGIRSSTLGSASVESCIKKRLGYWRFPAPANAGAVKVSYPFLFRTR